MDLPVTEQDAERALAERCSCGHPVTAHTRDPATSKRVCARMVEVPTSNPQTIRYTPCGCGQSTWSPDL